MEDIQYNRNIILIGAGGLGRELYSWILQSVESSSKYYVEGFIDDDNVKLSGFNNYPDILGKLESGVIEKYTNFIITISKLEIRYQIFNLLEGLNKNIFGFIHPSTLIGQNTILAPCLVTFPNCVISCDVKIGKSVFINNGSQIGHDVVIRDFVNIMANVDIGGNCEIGEMVTIGTGATILPGIKIPPNTFIGAGSVVFRSIKQPGTYVGNPAKKIF